MRLDFIGKTGAVCGTFAVIAFVSLAALAQQQTGDVRDRFAGVYELAAYAAHGDEPTGRIWYAPNGQMSALLFPPGRPPFTNSTSAEEYRQAMRGVIAYYGTYTVDPDAGIVTHHVMGASNPSWIGDDFVRWYRLDGDELTLSLNEGFDNTLLWRRVPED